VRDAAPPSDKDRSLRALVERFVVDGDLAERLCLKFQYFSLGKARSNYFANDLIDSLVSSHAGPNSLKIESVVRKIDHHCEVLQIRITEKPVDFHSYCFA
jgi:hypothetical protein